MEFEVREFSSLDALAANKSVVDVYQAVYSLPPYNESPSNVKKFSDSWQGRTEKPGFQFVGAKDDQKKIVGFCYGWRSISGDHWNTKLSEQLGDLSDLWLTDCFEFVDLAVLPAVQGYGLGRNLTHRLFSQVNAKTAILLTHQTTTKASQMYLRNGWVELKANFEVAPGKLYSIMGKTLRS